MSEQTATIVPSPEPVSAEARPGRSWLWSLLRKPGAAAGGAVVLGIALLAVLAPLVAPHSPTEIFPGAALQAPSWRFPLGTDELGRDVLSRLIYGARVSMRVAVISVGIGLTVGTLLGLVVGFLGGVADNVVMRLMDVMFAFPEILLAIAIVAILGPGLDNTMIAIGIAVIPIYARTARAAALALKGEEFIEAARALGVGEFRIVFRHVLPNALSPIIVLCTVNVGTAILTTAGLSYIGLGAQPPTPEWGSMLASAQPYLSTAPWVSIFPGLVIFAVVMAFNLLGDAIRDVADPHHR